jgi:hypothetical protein
MREPIKDEKFTEAIAELMADGARADGIEVHGVSYVFNDGDAVEQNDEDPDFFSTYLHMASDSNRVGLTCVGDFKTREAAMAHAVELAAELNLPITEIPPKPTTLFWVGIYDVAQNYGGPEEGGWYYDSGSLVTNPVFYGDLLPRCFTSRAEARAYLQQMEARAKEANRAEGRRPKSSVLSRGEYEALIFEDALPTGFPDECPQYE